MRQTIWVVVAIWYLLISPTLYAQGAYRATLLHRMDFYGSEAHAISGGSQVGGFSSPATGVFSHAGLWHDTPGAVIDLHPAGFTDSRATGVYQGSQVGSGIVDSPGGQLHALLWHGTADSVVDLHPSGFNWSVATGISSDGQAGYGIGQPTGYEVHALHWQGTAESVIDLHPPEGFLSSVARNNWHGVQVGSASTGASYHAMLWTGTAASAVDLHPTGLYFSEALGAYGEYQVGYGRRSPMAWGQDSPDHALLWRGTAESVVDLHPMGFTFSQALGVSSQIQVGYGGLANGNRHALLWNGAAESVIDLYPSLANLGIGDYLSVATDIDEAGNIVGYVHDGTTTYAVLWTPVPEPSPIIFCSSLVLYLCSRRVQGF